MAVGVAVFEAITVSLVEFPRLSVPGLSFALRSVSGLSRYSSVPCAAEKIRLLFIQFDPAGTLLACSRCNDNHQVRATQDFSISDGTNQDRSPIDLKEHFGSGSGGIVPK